MKALLYDLVSIGILVALVVFSVTGDDPKTVKSVMNKVATNSSTTITEIL